MKTIQLNFIPPADQEIFDLLLDVVKTKTPSTVIRCAGGWVRDALLSLHSDDIDIAVDNMSGQDFAQLVIEYMNENKLNTKGVTVIKANPDQSKHLETAMVSIFGRSIDFANLRKESYTEDSRIPSMEFGTPLEDATRRDLTINALFYNINTHEVEDYVDGLKDLQLRIARTPIDPVQTFLDDPLRILRVIRFASRFDLNVSNEIVRAALDARIKNALEYKVSKERFWKEFAGQRLVDGTWKAGFICGKDPVKALKLMLQMKVLAYNSLKNNAWMFFIADHKCYDTESLLVRNLSLLFMNLYDVSKELIKDKSIFKRVNLLSTTHMGSRNDKVNRELLTTFKSDWKIACDVSCIMNHYDKESAQVYLQSLIDSMGGTDIKLPIDGNDVLSFGAEPKDVGKILNELRQYWFTDPTITREHCLDIAQKAVNILSVNDIIK